MIDRGQYNKLKKAQTKMVFDSQLTPDSDQTQICDMTLIKSVLWLARY